MSIIFPQCPSSPEWTLDWESINNEYPWVRAMADCPQDPIHHAEGDVRIHTRMVCESLAEMSAWQMLTEADRSVVFAAALLHDVAKPVCTRHEDGRITSRGHSPRGEVMARSILWSMGVPMVLREQVAALIRFHQIPFFLLERSDSKRVLFKVSQSARCDLLSLVTEADARGRICKDKQRLLDNIALFVDYSREQNCLDRPRQFPSDHSRFLYFRREDRDPDYLAYDDTICEVVLMSGLPGAGKDYWIAENLPDWPVISLDDLREELDIDPAESQGRVVAEARERAREFLRRNQSFIWNATNISRRIRQQCIDLFAAYNARVRIVYVDVPEETLFRQNRERNNPVPADVIRRLLDRWEVPDLTEAHKVEWISRTN
ncbi:MAG TPA: AAA family ATPase [Blastocatellia bacterium]|nr:AAA family ATPase [Blastocatellia bacterium]